MCISNFGVECPFKITTLTFSFQASTFQIMKRTDSHSFV